MEKGDLLSSIVKYKGPIVAEKADETNIFQDGKAEFVPFWDFFKRFHDVDCVFGLADWAYVSVFLGVDECPLSQTAFMNILRRTLTVTR
jgi:hypothetical protein